MRRSIFALARAPVITGHYDIAPSVAAWNVLGDGSSAITWVCGILSGVQVLKTTFTYVEKQSVGGLLRRGREQLKLLRDHAAKLTPQERRLIESKRPGYLTKVERFMIRYDYYSIRCTPALK